jgi:hypothetical protein
MREKPEQFETSVNVLLNDTMNSGSESIYKATSSHRRPYDDRPNFALDGFEIETPKRNDKKNHADRPTHDGLGQIKAANDDTRLSDLASDSSLNTLQRSKKKFNFEWNTDHSRHAHQEHSHQSSSDFDIAGLVPRRNPAISQAGLQSLAPNFNDETWPLDSGLESSHETQSPANIWLPKKASSGTDSTKCLEVAMAGVSRVAAAPT